MFKSAHPHLAVWTVSTWLSSCRQPSLYVLLYPHLKGHQVIKLQDRCSCCRQSRLSVLFLCIFQKLHAHPV